MLIVRDALVMIMIFTVCSNRHPIYMSGFNDKHTDTKIFMS